MWDYKMMNFGERTQVYEIENRVCELAEEGWEFVQMALKTSAYGTCGYIVILKREME